MSTNHSRLRSLKIWCTSHTWTGAGASARTASVYRYPIDVDARRSARGLVEKGAGALEPDHRGAAFARPGEGGACMCDIYQFDPGALKARSVLTNL